MKVAFAANLDAELELQDPSYVPSTRMVAGLTARARAFAAQLGSDVVCLIPGARPPHPNVTGAPGLCWCPTPSALGLLTAGSARLPPAPPLEVLQRVNHRAFAEGLGLGLVLGRYVTTMPELDEHLARFHSAEPVLLKRPFGFAGRGRKRLPSPNLIGPARRWAAASMTQYGRGLLVEPWCHVLLDVALHGFVATDGQIVLGTPTVQENDADGAWLRSRPATDGDLDRHDQRDLRAAAERVAAALHDAGYFGPFGIDAYRFLRNGRPDFQPLSDLNARLTMGWCIGMGGDARQILLQRA